LVKVNEIDRSQLAHVKSGFFARGESVSEWALAHGFNPALVYGVLSGRTKGRRGQAHLIAVELGLKPSPLASDIQSPTKEESDPRAK